MIDESRDGLVNLAVLAHYRLVNLDGAEALTGIRGEDRLQLAAFCDRPHGADEEGGVPGPFLLAVADAGGTSDNLSELAWAAIGHEHDHHGGDQPYRRAEVGDDLDRLYRNTSTLWRNVEIMARALGLTWSTDDPDRIFRAAVHRLTRLEPALAAFRRALAGVEQTREVLAARDALAPLEAVTVPGPVVDQVTVSRCPVLTPRDQAEAIAVRAGVHRIDGDWQCYLAPHSGEKHTARPTPDGHLYHFDAEAGLR